MKKIKILKNIIDFIWWLSITAIVILFFILLGTLTGIIEVSPNFRFSINETDLDNLTKIQQIILIILHLTKLLLIYSLYLFRQIIHNFNSLKIFNNLIIKNFNLIGYNLIVVGFAFILSDFIAPLFNNIIYMNFHGFGVGLISAGLFSIVLSEIFKIAKTQKQENDLTI
ncbi:DUF2975 domain-containing protein [Polaribacter aestuariivivens]|uniref:DUF2975 domain-containing protein n=1 Tax=Polaribacter aestuariivivens TaxID=2304626 RepID=A0A5S3NAM9_9FLAO|nr:DUF2975 domain-containing protein [Polaribacter aestuariivivens]TMM30669.1 DUF2975 domain-containing protein [Polaribacter aestuariivivens]